MGKAVRLDKFLADSGAGTTNRGEKIYSKRYGSGKWGKNEKAGNKGGSG